LTNPESKQQVRAPRGSRLTCLGWPQEAALRMLINSLDEVVAEKPQDLAVCEETDGPVKDWDGFHAIVHSLKSLKNDKTLFVQPGEPADVFKTTSETPRVVIAGEGPPSSESPDTFSEGERLGRALFGYDAARSWSSVGSQQALQSVFETFAAVGRAHFGGDLAGRLIVSGGMGRAGGTQPLAATLQGAAFLGIDVDGERITRRIRTGYCDFCVNSLDEALRILKNAVRLRQPVSVGLVGNCAETIPELASRGVVPDILSDLTGAGDRLTGYVPAGLSLQEAEALRRKDPKEYMQRACDSVVRQARGMAELRKLGAAAFDFGNRLHGMALKYCGIKEDLRLPGFVPTYLGPAFSEGRAQLRWLALSGDAQDIRRTDELLLELFPDDTNLAHWIRLARRYVKPQGLPARVGWLSQKQRTRYAEQLNALVAKGELKAPVVIVRDQMNCDSEILRLIRPGGLKGASVPVKIQTIVNALLKLGSGASWMSLQGKGTETSTTCRATQAALADGSPGAAKRLQRLMESECGFSLFGRTRTGDEKAPSSHHPPAERSRG